VRFPDDEALTMGSKLVPMHTTRFPITPIRKLRRDAERASGLPRHVPEGWSKSTVDPTHLLDCFPALRLKPGFRLCAYQFREGGNGNGFIWGLPDGATFPAPDKCPRLEDTFLEPPKPPDAVHVLDAIEGDGSPWSYMCASVFAREAAEFGSMWHGVSWGVAEILWRSPFLDMDALQDSRGSFWFLSPDDEHSEWEWVGQPPKTWRPSCTFDFEGVTVRFLTWTELGERAITLHTDRFRRGSYKLESEASSIATSGAGFVW
jgi:hypothetical protein